MNLAIGDKIKIAGALLEITQIGKSAIKGVQYMMQWWLRYAQGRIFAKVITGGEIKIMI